MPDALRCGNSRGGHHETQHRPHPDDACRQPAAARRSARDDPAETARRGDRRGGASRPASRAPSPRPCGARRRPASTSSPTARWAASASSPMSTSASTGIEPSRGAEPANYWNELREYRAFPEFYAWAAQMPGAAGQTGRTRWVCTGPIAYKGMAALQRDIATLKEALAGSATRRRSCRRCRRPTSRTGTATSITRARRNTSTRWPMRCTRNTARSSMPGWYCRSTTRCSPPITSMHPEASVEDCRKWAMARVDALNHALRGLPADRIRYHTCYSINIGPRVHDMELKHIIDIMLRINAGAYSFEAANPRHEHEWKVWRGGEAARRQVADPRRHHAFLEHRRAPGADRRAHRPLRRRRSGAKTSSPAPIAASRALPRPARSIRASSGSSSRRWPRARGSPAPNCGGIRHRGRRATLDRLRRRSYICPPWKKRAGPTTSS